MVGKKSIFLQALFLTIVVFFIGLYIGVLIESNNLERVEGYFAQSEVDLMDIVALNNLIDSGEVICEDLKQANFDFANRLYEEASILEDYEESGKFTENLMFVHQKYDLLRTFLWLNALNVQEKCGKDFDIVVYLYEYNPEDLTIKAEQSVWSKILLELKSKHDEDLLLIPIAKSADFVSLEALLADFDISEYPVVIIDGEQVIYDLTSSDSLEGYLN